MRCAVNHSGLYLHRFLEQLDRTLSKRACSCTVAFVFERFGVAFLDQAFGFE